MKKYLNTLNNIPKDKLLHFFWSSILLMPLVLIFGSFYGCALLVVIAALKELVLDDYLGKGNPELLDFAFGILPILIYVIL